MKRRFFSAKGERDDGTGTQPYWGGKEGAMNRLPLTCERCGQETNCRVDGLCLACRARERRRRENAARRGAAAERPYEPPPSEDDLWEAARVRYLKKRGDYR